jgi:hypothetical protein
VAIKLLRPAFFNVNVLGRVDLAHATFAESVDNPVTSVQDLANQRVYRLVGAGRGDVTTSAAVPV